MHAVVKERLEAQFKEAEFCGRCYAPLCRNDQRALRRAATDVSELHPERYRRDNLIPSFVVTPFTGMYMRGNYWLRLTSAEVALHILRALAERHPEWVFCSHSAALLHGLEVPWELMKDVHVAQSRDRVSKSARGIVRHTARSGHSITVNGGRAVILQEAILGSLCSAPFELTLGIVDSALHQRRITLGALEAYFEVMGCGRKGIERARFTLSRADARAENGGESRARAVMIEEGFAPHELQVAIPDPMNPMRILRGDMGWLRSDGSWCIGELDGREKYENPSMTQGQDSIGVLLDERLRESRMTAYNLHVMRFPFSYVLDRWKLTLLMQTYGVPRSEIPIIP